MSDWKEARQAVRAGEVVFFPKLNNAQVWSLFAYDRKKGLRLVVKRVVYQKVLGCMTWRVQ